MLVVGSPPSSVSNKTAGPSPRLIACSQSHNKSESIEQLVQAIKADREYNGLRGLNVTVKEDGVSSSIVHFEGFTPNLLQRAFFNRTGPVSRVILGGDSTLMFPSEKLVFLEDNPRLMLPRNVSEANEALDSALGDKKKPDCTIKQSKETRMKKRQHEYVDFRRPKPEGCRLSTQWKHIADRDPEVLVVNMGLHWTHFQAVAGARDVQACQAERWLDYEKDFLQSVLDKARRMPSMRLLLFKTTNYICEDVFNAAFAEANKLYHAKDKATMDSCRTAIQSMLPGRHERQIESYCHDGTINEQGAAHLNARLLKFVQQLQPEEGNLTVQVFNDHDLESCEYTREGDGRHYHALDLTRLRYLANVIMCYLDDAPEMD